MQYQPLINIWSLNDKQRANLQPGQWVEAGKNGPRGQWCGKKPISGIDVVAWKANRVSKRGYYAYFDAMREYSKK